MNVENFQVLEDKINQLIDRLLTLKNENKELNQANRRLEDKAQELMDELESKREENRGLSEKLDKMGNSQTSDDEIRSRLEGLLGKIDEVVGG